MKKSIYQKRSTRVRKKLKKVSSDRFRLSIYRSSKNISAQIIDSKNNKTLVSATSVSKKSKGKKKSEKSSHLCLYMLPLSHTKVTQQNTVSKDLFRDLSISISLYLSLSLSLL